jgi:hypothetical protein
MLHDLMTSNRHNELLQAGLGLGKSTFKHLKTVLDSFKMTLGKQGDFGLPETLR